MTGQDIFFWLENIWFGMTHLEQTDVLSLAFRLIVLFITLFILWRLTQSFIKAASRILVPIWRSIISPARALQRRSRARKHRKENQKQQEIWEREQREEEVRNRIQQAEQERKRLEELEEIKKALVID